MANFWKTKALDALKKEWEQKLKEAGFEDIEEEVAGERLLKRHSGYTHRNSDSKTITGEAKLEYFLLISQLSERERAFEDESDKLIMCKTGDGWTIQEISQELVRLGMEKFNRDTIRYIRRRYENKWGIKQWKPEDMVSRRVRTR